MKTLFKRSLIALASSLILSTAAHAQFAVIDPAAIAQMVTQYGQMLEQYTVLKNQYDQAMTTYNAVKGVTKFSDILNSPELMSTLPKEWQDVAAKVKTSASYTAELAKLGTAPTAAGQKRNEVFAANAAAMTDYFTQANARVKNVQDLIGQIKSTSDPKEKQDLANRMMGEQNAIQASSQVLALLQQKQTQEVQAANDNFVKERRCKVYGKC